MFKLSVVALATVVVGFSTAAVANSDLPYHAKAQFYGEIGVGGYLNTNSDYHHDEFYQTKNYVDDSFASFGVKGVSNRVIYRLELDYQRQNWLGGSGEFELDIDKLYLGYQLTEHQWLELGLTDTAFDDFDHFGDFSFNKAAETGEAGDQENTIKYQAEFAHFIYGISYSYEGKHKNGALQGDIINGYLGFISEYFAIVIGGEGRGGSHGESKYGEQQLLGLGLQWHLNSALSLGLNAFAEDEDIATLQSGDVYLNYQRYRNYGAVLSSRYQLSSTLAFIAAASLEQYEQWDIESPNYNSEALPPEFGKERRWGTAGIHYWPNKNTVLALEGRIGEAPEAGYAYARIYF